MKIFLKWIKLDNILLQTNKVSIDKTLSWIDYRRTYSNNSSDKMFYSWNKYLLPFFCIFSYELDAQTNNLGYFINKSKRDMKLSLQPQLAGFPTINSSLWSPVQLCTNSWLNQNNANVMCRSMGHFGGGIRYVLEWPSISRIIKLPQITTIC